MGRKPKECVACQKLCNLLMLALLFSVICYFLEEKITNSLFMKTSCLLQMRRDILRRKNVDWSLRYYICILHYLKSFPNTLTSAVGLEINRYLLLGQLIS